MYEATCMGAAADRMGLCRKKVPGCDCNTGGKGELIRAA